MVVNFFGIVEVIKIFLFFFRKFKGRLVNVSSMGGGVLMVRLVFYGLLKVVVIMFLLVMRIEFFKWGIKVVFI